MIQAIPHGSGRWELQLDAGDGAAPQEELDTVNYLLDEQRFEEAMQLSGTLVMRYPEDVRVLTLFAECYDTDIDMPSAFIALHLAIGIFRRALPARFGRSGTVTDTLPWDYPGNRVLFKACRSLIDLYLDVHNIKAARELGEWMLRVEPGDELGIRTLLPRLYMLEKNAFGIHRLRRDYPDDYAPEILFSALYIAILNGDCTAAERLWQEADADFPLVVDELLKTRHDPPKDYDPDISYYSDTEETAYSYWLFYGDLWRKDTKIRNFIAEKRRQREA